MKLQEARSAISKVVKFPASVTSYLRTDVGQNEQYYGLKGGLLKDTQYAWLSWGPNFEVIRTTNGAKVAAWTFGAVLRDFKTRVTCVTELPCNDGSGRVSQFVVGLECELNGGMICVFDIRGSKVLRAVQMPSKVTSLSVVDYGSEGCYPLPQLLSSMTGVLAVGLAGGQIMLVDLCRINCDEGLNVSSCGDLRDELHACQLLPISVHETDQETLEYKRAHAARTGDHLCVVLNESFLADKMFLLPLPDGNTFSVQRRRVDVTALMYVPRIASIVAGFSFGSFQIWNLMQLTLEYMSPTMQDPLPVVSFGFQEPCDDPRNFCYLWAVHSSSLGFRNRLPFAVMYALCYQAKEWVDGYGYLNQDFVSCAHRFDFDLDGDEGGITVIGGRNVACHTINKVSPAAARKDNPRAELDESVQESDLTLCLFVWETWGANCPGSTRMALFDLNQWYKEQMPGKIVKGQVLTYMTVFSLDEVVEASAISANHSNPLLDVKVDPASLSQFTAVQSLEEHFYPSALAFESFSLLGEELVKVSHAGVQRDILSQLESSGPSALVHPTKLFYHCIAVGLKPVYTDVSTTFNCPLVEQREFLMSVALEYQLVGFLSRCAVEWVDGSQSAMGCTLPALLKWGWQRATTLKTHADNLCIPLYDYSGVKLDSISYQLLDYCGNQLHHLTTFFQGVLKMCKNPTIRGIGDLSQQARVLELVAVYIEVVEWFVNVGLLPEYPCEDLALVNDGYETAGEFGPHRVPYPAAALSKIYQKRRADLERLSRCAADKTDILFIDGLVKRECNGDRLSSLWERDGGNGLYPPPSIQSLLRTYLLDGIPMHVKHCIVIYVFLDLTGLLESRRYTATINQFIKFPSAFRLTPSFIKITQALWLLDHQDYTEAIDMLLDPLVSMDDMKPWQHQCIIRAFLYQGQHQMALKYIRVQQPPLKDIEDIRLNLTVLLVNGLIHEAFQYQRQHCNEQNSRDLLEHFFSACQQMNQLSVVLQLALSPVEEEAFTQFLKSCHNPRADDMHVMYYLERSRIAEAMEVNDNIRSSRSHIESNSLKRVRTEDKPSCVRDTIVQAYANTLPSVTRKLALYCSQEKSCLANWKQVSRPTPMSVAVHRGESQPVRYRSSLIQATLEKARETWSQVIQLPAPPSTPAKRDRSSMEKTSVEMTPFLCTPRAATETFVSTRDVTAVVFPTLTYPSPKSDDEIMGGSPVKRLRYSDHYPSPVGSVIPSSRKRLDRYSDMDALSLLQTPHVRRRTPSSVSRLKEQQDLDSSATTIFTPHSILKKMVHRSVSPDNLSQVSVPSYTGTSTTPELLEEEGEVADEKMQVSDEEVPVGRQIRFSFPSDERLEETPILEEAPIMEDILLPPVTRSASKKSILGVNPRKALTRTRHGSVRFGNSVTEKEADSSETLQGLEDMELTSVVSTLHNRVVEGHKSGPPQTADSALEIHNSNERTRESSQIKQDIEHNSKSEACLLENDTTNTEEDSDVFHSLENSDRTVDGADIYSESPLKKKRVGSTVKGEEKAVSGLDSLEAKEPFRSQSSTWSTETNPSSSTDEEKGATGTGEVEGQGIDLECTEIVQKRQEERAEPADVDERESITETAAEGEQKNECEFNTEVILEEERNRVGILLDTTTYSGSSFEMSDVMEEEETSTVRSDGDVCVLDASEVEVGEDGSESQTDAEGNVKTALDVKEEEEGAGILVDNTTYNWSSHEISSIIEQEEMEEAASALTSLKSSDGDICVLDDNEDPVIQTVESIASSEDDQKEYQTLEPLITLSEDVLEEKEQSVNEINDDKVMDVSSELPDVLLTTGNKEHEGITDSSEEESELEEGEILRPKICPADIENESDVGEEEDIEEEEEESSEEEGEEEEEEDLEDEEEDLDEEEEFEAEIQHHKVPMSKKPPSDDEESIVVLDSDSEDEKVDPSKRAVEERNRAGDFSNTDESEEYEEEGDEYGEEDLIAEEAEDEDGGIDDNDDDDTNEEEEEEENEEIISKFDSSSEIEHDDGTVTVQPEVNAEIVHSSDDDIVIEEDGSHQKPPPLLAVCSSDVELKNSEPHVKDVKEAREKEPMDFETCISVNEISKYGESQGKVSEVMEVDVDLSCKEGFADNREVAMGQDMMDFEVEISASQISRGKQIDDVNDAKEESINTSKTSETLAGDGKQSDKEEKKEKIVVKEKLRQEDGDVAVQLLHSQSIPKFVQQDGVDVMEITMKEAESIRTVHADARNVTVLQATEEVDATGHRIKARRTSDSSSLCVNKLQTRSDVEEGSRGVKPHKTSTRAGSAQREVAQDIKLSGDEVTTEEHILCNDSGVQERKRHRANIRAGSVQREEIQKTEFFEGDARMSSSNVIPVDKENSNKRTDNEQNSTGSSFHEDLPRIEIESLEREVPVASDNADVVQRDIEVTDKEPYKREALKSSRTAASSKHDTVSDNTDSHERKLQKPCSIVEPLQEEVCPSDETESLDRKIRKPSSRAGSVQREGVPSDETESHERKFHKLSRVSSIEHEVVISDETETCKRKVRKPSSRAGSVQLEDVPLDETETNERKVRKPSSRASSIQREDVLSDETETCKRKVRKPSSRAGSVQREDVPIDETETNERKVHKPSSRPSSIQREDVLSDETETCKRKVRKPSSRAGSVQCEDVTETCERKVCKPSSRAGSVQREDVPLDETETNERKVCKPSSRASSIQREDVLSDETETCKIKVRKPSSREGSVQRQDVPIDEAESHERKVHKPSSRAGSVHCEDVSSDDTETCQRKVHKPSSRAGSVQRQDVPIDEAESHERKVHKPSSRAGSVHREDVPSDDTETCQRKVHKPSSRAASVQDEDILTDEMEHGKRKVCKSSSCAGSVQSEVVPSDETESHKRKAHKPRSRAGSVEQEIVSTSKTDSLERKVCKPNRRAGSVHRDHLEEKESHNKNVDKSGVQYVDVPYKESNSKKCEVVETKKSDVDSIDVEADFQDRPSRIDSVEFEDVAFHENRHPRASSVNSDASTVIREDIPHLAKSRKKRATRSRRSSVSSSCSSAQGDEGMDVDVKIHSTKSHRAGSVQRDALSVLYEEPEEIIESSLEKEKVVDNDETVHFERRTKKKHDGHAESSHHNFSSSTGSTLEVKHSDTGNSDVKIVTKISREKSSAGDLKCDGTNKLNVTHACDADLPAQPDDKNERKAEERCTDISVFGLEDQGIPGHSLLTNKMFSDLSSEVGKPYRKAQSEAGYVVGPSTRNKRSTRSIVGVPTRTTASNIGLGTDLNASPVRSLRSDVRQGRSHRSSGSVPGDGLCSERSLESSVQWKEKVDSTSRGDSLSTQQAIEEYATNRRLTRRQRSMLERSLELAKPPVSQLTRHRKLQSLPENSDDDDEEVESGEEDESSSQISSVGTRSSSRLRSRQTSHKNTSPSTSQASTVQAPSSEIPLHNAGMQTRRSRKSLSGLNDNTLADSPSSVISDASTLYASSATSARSRLAASPSSTKSEGVGLGRVRRRSFQRAQIALRFTSEQASVSAVPSENKPVGSSPGDSDSDAGSSRISIASAGSHITRSASLRMSLGHDSDGEVRRSPRLARLQEEDVGSALLSTSFHFSPPTLVLGSAIRDEASSIAPASPVPAFVFSPPQKQQPLPKPHRQNTASQQTRTHTMALRGLHTITEESTPPSTPTNTSPPVSERETTPIAVKKSKKFKPTPSSKTPQISSRRHFMTPLTNQEKQELAERERASRRSISTEPRRRYTVFKHRKLFKMRRSSESDQ